MLFINQRGATKLRGTHLRFAAFSDKEKTRLDGFAMAPTQLKNCVENHILEEEMLQVAYESLQGTIGENIKESWEIKVLRN
ncbi:unnamed protein product [Brassica oleracea var. botrytis]|uniref:(rape) hypothetical protein n=1 Tax=Brassica napus TaxID=3708 RepID=A0A816M0I8_BRANA|nr:unnamed protein product [Brassica napus]